VSDCHLYHGAEITEKTPEQRRVAIRVTYVLKF